MKSKADYLNFYKNEIAPYLESLEKQRKKTVASLTFWLTLYTIFIGIPGIIIGITIARVSEDIGFFVIALAFGGGGMIYAYLTSGYVASFKNKIISRIINFIDGELKYSPKSVVHEDLFEQSKMFSKASSYSGNDHISGSLGSTTIAFSDVSASSGDGNSRVNIFRGIFVVADFNKYFKTLTYVMPNSKRHRAANSWITNIFKSLVNAHGDPVKLENSDFDKVFATFSKDQIEARYILTPDFMEKILKFRSKAWKRGSNEIYISFVNNRIYLGITYPRDILEPNIFQSLHKNTDVENYYYDLYFILNIVEDLDLNKRIWSKQSNSERNEDSKEGTTEILGEISSLKA